jgi:hypothetical protein
MTYIGPDGKYLTTEADQDRPATETEIGRYLGVNARDFLARWSQYVANVSYWAQMSAWAENVDEQLGAIRGMQHAHEQMRTLLPSPDPVATADLERGISTVIESCEVALQANRKLTGRPKFGDRRRFAKAFDRGTVDIQAGIARLERLAQHGPCPR